MEPRQDRGTSNNGGGTGDPSSSSAAPASGGQSWQYASLVRGASDADNVYSQGHQRNTGSPSPTQETASPTSPTPILPPWSPEDAVREHSKNLLSNLRWLLPAGLLVIAFFVQNLGQYAGTRGYVRWMDILNHPETAVQRAFDGTEQKPPVVEAALVDRAVMAFGVGEVSTGLLATLTSLLPLVWLVLLSYQKDLRLWVHTLLATSGLALIKGFLAWATIVPDAAGWSSCRKRLGDEGLSYYRQEMTGFHSVEALVDILLLELRGMWAGGEARGNYCTSGFISTPLYVSVVFSLGICDLAHRATHQMPSRQRFLWRTVIWTVLAFLVTMNVIIPIVSRHHYSADVVVSLLLSVLLYSSPAIALVAERWAQAASRDAPSGSVAHELFSSTGLDLEISAAREQAEDDTQAMDVGQVLAMPCGPWCWEEPVYYLRSQPGRLQTARPAHDKQDSHVEVQLQEQMAQFTTLEEEHARFLQEKEKALQDAREKARQLALEAAKNEEWKFKGRLAEQNRRLEAEEQKALQAAKQRLIAANVGAAGPDEKLAKEKELQISAEASFHQERDRLEESARQAEQELEDATRACQQCEADIAETQRKVQAIRKAPAQAAADREIAEPVAATQH